MPMDLSRYPANWKEISRAIRERDGNRCKWCNVENGSIGARDSTGKWRDMRTIDHMKSDEGFAVFGEYPKLIKIVLTVAHLGVDKPDGTPGDKHDKMDVRDENLAALCQRCHLNYDRDEHSHNAAVTRFEKKVSNGQQTFLDNHADYVKVTT